MPEWESVEGVLSKASDSETDYLAQLYKEHEVNPDEVDTEELIQLRLSKIRKRLRKPKGRK